LTEIDAAARDADAQSCHDFDGMYHYYYILHTHKKDAESEQETQNCCLSIAAAFVNLIFSYIMTWYMASSLILSRTSRIL